MVQAVESDEDSEISLDEPAGGDTPKGIPAADDILSLIERNSREASNRSMEQQKGANPNAIMITDSNDEYEDGEFAMAPESQKRSAGYFVQ